MITLRQSLLRSDPADLAEKLNSLPGFVFFDSATEKAGQISILAACPVETVHGNASDWHRLEAIVEKYRSTVPADLGGAFGAVIGAVDYDGSFEFSVYPDLLLFQHGSAHWQIAGQPSWIDFEGEKSGTETLHFVPDISEATFVNSVTRAKEYIAAGDIYQVNLAQRFAASLAGDLFPFYERLRALSPAPHCAFLRQKNRCIASSSPETFLKLDGRQALSRPIKGTRPRFRDALRDERSAYELITSAKEVSELVMITDLIRNDLGAISEYGSVTVTELLKLERFAQVFHLVSTVESRLWPDVTHARALRSAFPGGSITGAPKKRAMEIIQELETTPRGLFTGAIGYIGFNEESQFSIAIRTVEAAAGKAMFHVGSGIVADSNPEAEYQETLHKAAGILMAAGG